MTSRKDILRTSVVCSLVAVLLLTSCAPPPAKAGEFVRSDAERVSSPDVSDTDLAELVGGNSAFAYDLYQAWREQEGNLFYSPYSISVALAMTYAGARGETEKQMAETLHFLLSQYALHPALNALDQELARRAAAAESEEDEAFRLSIANSIWGQVGYDFLPAFLDLLAENYGAGLRLTDFAKDPDKSRVIINDWISDQTEARIKDLIPEGGITPLTRLVLANAIYFKATWLHQFDESRTRDWEFNLLNGEQVSVPMMSLSDPPSLLYARGNGYQAVELPYVGNQVAMTIIMPDAGEFEEFEAGLDAARMEEILAGLDYESVALRLPKFSFESSFSMAQTLAAMGMPDAVSIADADFSGMDGTHDLYIQNVFHKAFVAVDEAGTEAAAATAVVVGLKALMPSGIELTIDHPFIFLIRDTVTGSVLFVGRVLNPVSANT
ncbi:MAG: serpin family protein [Anaerolineae bacterium]|nr:serpin family protein [Anaerolineae bacterium]